MQADLPPYRRPLHDRTSTYFQPQCQCLAPLLIIETLCNPTLLTAVCLFPSTVSQLGHLDATLAKRFSTRYYLSLQVRSSTHLGNQPEEEKKPAITIRSGACGLYLHTGGTVPHTLTDVPMHTHTVRLRVSEIQRDNQLGQEASLRRAVPEKNRDRHAYPYRGHILPNGM
jgi:hypothetical protein